MNKNHLALLATDDWRNVLRDLIFPFAFKGAEPSDLGDDAIEVGPGPGLTTDLLLARIQRLTAIELDADLADALSARTDPARVTVVHGDATAMPFEAGRFSGAACFTMLHHVPDAAGQDRLFTEVCRVLRPGGVFIASDSVANDELAAFHEDDIYNPVDPATLEARLYRAGFDRVGVRVVPDRAWAVRAFKPA
ncbi:class I SAM-dependent methyltransferase [Spirillospora sp. NPDC048823]|uniref:class I SAM-dependent methyltransferase n=1 Tax=unclassified Spirillospora TaxID=2642701 RepID=UPI003716C73E